MPGGILGNLTAIVGVEGADRVTQNLNKMQEELSGSTKGLANLRAALLFASFGMMAAAQVIKQFTDPLVDLRQEMKETFSEVEFQAMSVSTILRGTGEVVDDVTKSMLKYGRTTEWTATEAGEAMEYLARAGFDVQTAMEGTSSVLNLATASTMDTKQAADVLTGALLGWSAGSAQAARDTQELNFMATELMTAAHNARQEVGDLAQAMKYATAAAQTVGWSFENVTAAISIAANSMVRAGIAGRAMRRMMTRLSRIAGTTSSGIEQAKSTLRKYNIELKDAEGNLKSLPDVVRELDTATEDLTKTQRANLYAQLAGMRGMNTMAVLVDKGADEIEKFATKLSAAAAKEAILKNEGGDLNDRLGDFRKMAKQAAGAGEQYGSIVTDLISEYGYTAKAAEKINSVVTDATTTQKEWNEAIKDAHTLSGVTAARLETLEGTTLLLNSSIEKLYATFGKEMKPLFVAFNRVVKALADMFGKLPAPVKVIIGVMILVVATVGQLSSKILMMMGMIMMTRAALASYVLEVEQVGAAQMKATSTTNMFTKAIGTVTEKLRITRFALMGMAASMGTLIVTTYLYTKRNDELTKSEKKLRQALMVLTPILTTAPYLYGVMANSTQGLSAITNYLTLSYLELAGAIFASVAIGWILFAVWKSVGDLGKVLIPVIYGVAAAILYLNTSLNLGPLEWLIYALSGLIMLILVIIDYFYDWSAGVDSVSQSLYGGSLIPIIEILLDVLGFLADGIKWIIDLFGSFGSIIEYVEMGVQRLIGWIGNLGEAFQDAGGWMGWLADLSDKLMGHSIIPEHFERGVGRIQSALGQLEDTNIGIKAGISEEEATKVVGSPRLNVDMRNMKVEEPLSADDISSIVDDATEKSLEKWVKEVKRTI